jgi:hypothetical protein
VHLHRQHDVLTRELDRDQPQVREHDDLLA